MKQLPAGVDFVARIVTLPNLSLSLTVTPEYTKHALPSQGQFASLPVAIVREVFDCKKHDVMESSFRPPTRAELQPKPPPERPNMADLEPLNGRNWFRGDSPCRRMFEPELIYFEKNKSL